MGRARARTAPGIVLDTGALIALDRGDSGELCVAAGSADVIDASVVLLARKRRDLIVTGDPDDLRRLDPSAQVVAI